MNTRPQHLLLVALVVLPACSVLVDQGEETSTGDQSTGVASSGGSSSTSSTGEVDDDGGSSSTSTSTGAGDTGSTSSSSTSTGEENGSTGSSSSTGEENSSNDLPGMVCGDGVEDLYEACDDGNDLPGDGCSADCRRWDRSGIAQDVPEVELVGWTPCWSSTYSENALVGGLLDSCTGPEMMLACRPVGAATFTVLAHAPQAEIIAPADPESADPWKVIHGSAWQWSTDQIAVFDPSKPSQSKCGGALCWPRIGDTLIPWGRCGDLEMGLESAPKWERVVLQSFY